MEMSSRSISAVTLFVAELERSKRVDDVRAACAALARRRTAERPRGPAVGRANRGAHGP